MDTISEPMFEVLVGLYVTLMVVLAAILAWDQTIGRLLRHRLQRRIERAEAAEKAALFDLLVLEEQLDREALQQADRQIAERMNEVWPDWHVEVAGSQFYPPLGPLSRPLSLPSIHEAFGLPNPPADMRPQWERELDEIVRARWDA